ncbi:MAG: hypothetical protein ACI9WU_004335 [Myxococcota bacterium]|jgi:hypothetical protein
MMTKNQRRALFLLAAGLLFGGSAMAESTEEPSYTVVTEHPDWELRRYQPSLEARVVVSGDFRTAVSSGFRRLADYIFGANLAPSGGPEKIAMTAPVSAQAKPGSERRWTVTFTMPAQFTRATLPVPSDRGISIIQNGGGLVAATRFRGRIAAEDDYDGHADRLLAALQADGLVASEPSLTAQYNGPWVPGPLRRNEVLVPVRCLSAADPRCARGAPAP